MKKRKCSTQQRRRCAQQLVRIGQGTRSLMGQDAPEQRKRATAKRHADDQHILRLGQHEPIEQQMNALTAQPGQRAAPDRVIDVFGGQFGVVAQTSQTDFVICPSLVTLSTV